MNRFMCIYLLVFAMSTSTLWAETPAKAASTPSPNQDTLKKILLGQEEILRQLDEIKKELAIVKARATR